MLERLELEAFLTLAEELHFGRTAERLHVSTGRISQTIRALERRLGAQLFERTSRTVTLTPVGKQLRDDLLPAYRQISAGLNAASLGSTARKVLTVGFSAPWCGNLMVRAADLMRIRYPDSIVNVEEIQLTDPLGRMRSGAVDLQLTEFPISEPDITTGPILFSEPRSLLVPVDHPFAQRDSVDLEDLGDAILITLNDELIPRYWMDYYFPRRTPAGRPVPQGPATNFWPEVLVHVNAGVGVSTVSARAEQFHSGPGMVFVPFRDAPPIDYGLMWPTDTKNPLVRPFLDLVQEAATPA
ncbi:LysR family transcriptional regulator [Nocardia huaxiensis]|uniref:LysR family transcriptional regulator n=1 Tax=Nocardia huaxiensis TaxID=2755382 RepID=A0A7D6VDA0_9NOCA|nr:LysR family transcriptional regulator [Nocardia huaxiensis]QLY33792.1 LysR family transcriptional regulator [Nocardia huaxiensis]UFS99283.1 LysR family transcriptional regulator [Nocardia huaxiensis]